MTQNIQGKTLAEVRWQPVLLMLDKRLECFCGALATIITGKTVENEYNSLEEADVWCQSCFMTASQKEANPIE